MLAFNGFAYKKTNDHCNLEDRFQKKGHFSIAYTVGPRYMRVMGTPKIDSHIMNSHIKRPRMTDN